MRIINLEILLFNLTLLYLELVNDKVRKLIYFSFNSGYKFYNLFNITLEYKYGKTYSGDKGFKGYLVLFNKVIVQFNNK